MADPQGGHLARATERNIETVANLERRFQKERTWHDRLADVIGGFSGSIYFVLIPSRMNG